MRPAMINIRKLAFSGQHIYVGLDVHEKSWIDCLKETTMKKEFY